MFVRISSTFLFAASLFAQSLEPPQGLTVVSASNKQVQLKWTAGGNNATGYTIERKPLNGTYASVLTVNSGTTVTVIDSNIDAYTAYTYRVRGTASGNSSDPSNEVTVGPPPFGYNTVVGYPGNMDPYYSGHFAANVRMMLDSSGDPALAYAWLDPNLDGDWSDSALYFVRWDRAHYQWTTPVKIAAIGEVGRGTLAPISVALDFSNGMFGIAFENESDSKASKVSLALSTDRGQTWTLQTVAVDTGDQTFGFSRPSLAMAAGNVHVTFYHDFDGVRHVTGKESDDPSKWTSTLIPLPTGYTAYDRHSSMALDSNGKPAVAFIVHGDNGAAEAFWRPGGTAVLISDNQGHQNDDPDLRLSFFGTRPRLVFAGAMDDNFFADYDHGLWIIDSPDNGTTWSRPVNVCSDGNRDLNGPMDAASGSKGQLAVVSEDNSGNSDGVNCTDPKLSMSSDLVNWITWGTSPRTGPLINAHSPNVAYGANDKLFVGFQQTNTGDGYLPLGVIVWRQPPDWAFPPPAAQ